MICLQIVTRFQAAAAATNNNINNDVVVIPLWKILATLVVYITFLNMCTDAHTKRDSSVLYY